MEINFRCMLNMYRNIGCKFLSLLVINYAIFYFFFILVYLVYIRKGRSIECEISVSRIRSTRHFLRKRTVYIHYR